MGLFKNSGSGFLKAKLLGNRQVGEIFKACIYSRKRKLRLFSEKYRSTFASLKNSCIFASALKQKLVRSSRG